MAKKKQNIPSYGTIEINGVTYFRTRINDYYSVEGNYLDKRICHSSCPKHIWLGF